MSTQTDPARELAELCERLARISLNASVSGEVFLSQTFGEEAWSREFYQIIFTILDRVDMVSRITANLDLDDDIRNEAVQHLAEIKYAFSQEAMRHPWAQFGAIKLGNLNSRPIKMLAKQVREVAGYPKLEEDEIAELQAMITDLLIWLHEHQLREQDFVRQALIEGLQQFEFRLSRLAWLGWGYTIESLKACIAAYMAIERGDISADPQADAVLKKLGALFGWVYEKIKAGKEGIEATDFVLRLYGAVMLTAETGHGIAGLLPSLGGG